MEKQKLMELSDLLFNANSIEINEDFEPLEIIEYFKVIKKIHLNAITVLKRIAENTSEKCPNLEAECCRLSTESNNVMKNINNHAKQYSEVLEKENELKEKEKDYKELIIKCIELEKTKKLTSEENLNKMKDKISILEKEISDSTETLMKLQSVSTQLEIDKDNIVKTIGEMGLVNSEKMKKWHEMIANFESKLIIVWSSDQPDDELKSKVEVLKFRLEKNTKTIEELEFIIKKLETDTQEFSELKIFIDSLDGSLLNNNESKKTYDEVNEIHLRVDKDLNSALEKIRIIQNIRYNALERNRNLKAENKSEQLPYTGCTPIETFPGSK